MSDEHRKDGLFRPQRPPAPGEGTFTPAPAYGLGASAPDVDSDVMQAARRALNGMDHLEPPAQLLALLFAWRLVAKSELYRTLGDAGALLERRVWCLSLLDGAGTSLREPLDPDVVESFRQQPDRAVSDVLERLFHPASDS